MTFFNIFFSISNHQQLDLFWSCRFLILNEQKLCHWWKWNPTNVITPEFHSFILNFCHLQQDDATCHTINNIIDYSRETFLNRIFFWRDYHNWLSGSDTLLLFLLGTRKRKYLRQQPSYLKIEFLRLSGIQSSHFAIWLWKISPDGHGPVGVIICLMLFFVH